MNALDLLEKAISKAGTMSAFADQNNFPKGYLSDVRAGRRDPSERLLAVLGLERVSVIKKRKS